MTITSSTKPFDEVEYLAEQGVAVDAEPNRRIRELEAPVREFAKFQSNRVPNSDEVEAVLPHLRLLADALDKWKQDGVAAKQYEHSLDTQLDALGRALGCKKVDSESPLIPLAFSAVRAGAVHASPEPGLGVEESLDGGLLSWGSPSPRIAAANVVMRIPPILGAIDAEVRRWIQALARDPVPAVRFQIAAGLTSLWQSDRDLMWELIQELSEEEQSGGVLVGLILTLESIARVPSETDRVVALINLIRGRELRPISHKTIRSRCVRFFTDRHIWRGHPGSGELVTELLEAIPEDSDIAADLLGGLRKSIIHGDDPSNEREKQIRARALDLSVRLFDKTLEAFLAIRVAETSNSTAGTTDKQDIAHAQSLFHVLESIPQEFYLASGAFDSSEGCRKTKSPGPAARRLFHEARALGIFEKIAQCEFALVVHHLIELLEFFIEEDPSWVFATITQAVRAGTKDAYQFESQAAKMLVRIVERYLATHRIVFGNSERRRELVEVLNTFVGWPEAHRLVYRLEDVFR